MKRFTGLLVTFILWPAVARGGFDVVEYDSLTNFPVFCANETVSLFNQKSLTLREDFITSRSIRCVNIKDTRLDIAAGSFNGLPNLMYLDLSGNSIEESSNLFSFGNLPNVRMIRLGGMRSNYNNYMSIVVQDEYPELMYLDLSNIYIIQNIEILSSNPFPKLTHLDMSRTQSYRGVVPFLPFVRHTLKYFDLSNSDQSNLGLLEMSNLETLILDGNNFDNIGRDWNNWLDLKGLSNLVDLSVANNQINYITETAFEDTVYLRHLNLSMNYLQNFNAKVLSGLYFLEVLVLDDNSLDTVLFDARLNITTLSLNCNRIKHLSTSSFSYVPYLRQLFLNGNEIRNLSAQTFQHLVELSELHLSDNQLSYIPTNIWKYLKKLKYLDVSGNILTSLTYLAGCPANRIGFDRNPIEYINASEFSVLPWNMLIYLNVGMESEVKPCLPKLKRLGT